MAVRFGERVHRSEGLAWDEAALELPILFELVAAVTAQSPLLVAGSKLTIDYAIDHSTADAVQQMTRLHSSIFDIDEMASAIEAWKNKQAASFDALAALTPV